jgi:uncharacterized lipoprotein
MKVIIKILLLSLGLVSCGGPTESRYRDTAMLERPPTLPVTHQSADQSAQEYHKLGQAKIQQEHEEPSVYMKSTMPALLMIRQPFELGWDTLGHALKQDYLRVTYRQQAKGIYFITYSPQVLEEKGNGFFDKALSVFKEDLQEEYYVLTVTEQHLETQANISVNQQKTTTDGSSPSAEDADKLLLLIYKSMNDKPKPEK